jgi:hypothetical protein
MKRLLILLLLSCPVLCHAQSSVDTTTVGSFEPLFNLSLSINKDVRNPVDEAGRLMQGAVIAKSTAFGFTLLSPCIWLFKGMDDKTKTAISLASGALAIASYCVALRYEWMAGKYLRMSASPSGITAAIKF